MKKIITISFFLFSLINKAQVFTGPGGPIQDNGQTTYYTLNVSGLNSSQIDSVFGLEQVCINISHPNVHELYIYLQSPSGTLVELSLGSSLSGSGFSNTCFNNQGGSSITLGITPFSGTYKPVGFLGRFNTGQPGNGNWILVVHDGFPSNNAGTLVSWNLKFGTVPAHPVVFKSSNLPIVFVNASQPITEYSTTVSMGIIDNGANRNYVSDPWNGYNGKAGINIRGNSTKNFPKKSYSFETLDVMGNEFSVPVLGMPSESDWVLGASYADKTLLRIPLAYDLFRAMGHYSPRFKFVELIMNNEYHGVYALIEKPKRNSNRINIEKLDASENALPYVSGGYIVKIDRNDDPGWFSLLPGNCTANSKFYYQYVYPKPLEITASQQNYIQTYMNDFETMMNSPYYSDPLTGYPKYVDVNSFVDYFIVNELSKNVDAYRLSTYLFKETILKGGKLSVGPVWDYDIAWHNCNYGNSDNPSGWAYLLQDNDYPVPNWWTKFMQDSNFVNKLYCRWNELRQNIITTNYLNSWIDANANVLNEGRERNFRQWPVIGAYIYPNPQNQVNASYGNETNDLKNWIANRINWLDANIWGKCSVGFNETDPLVRNVIVYPNPMQQSTTFLLKLEKEAHVSLSITDIAGKEVARYLNNKIERGDSRIVFERNRIEAGMYLYQLQIGNSIKTGKIVIQ